MKNIMNKNFTLLVHGTTNIDVRTISNIRPKINTILFALYDEGHQALGLVNVINTNLRKYNLHKQVLHYIFIGNYTEEHHFDAEDKKVSLIPHPNAPFDVFHSGRGLTFFNHEEPIISNKKSKVSFIYYGRRIERDIIFCELYKKNLLENTIYHSADKGTNEKKIIYSETQELIENGYSDIGTYEKVKNILPMGDQNFNARGYDYLNETVQLGSKSLFYIISETNISQNNTVNVSTEKPAIAFLSKSIPIFITYDSPKSIKWFENLGFDCFTDVIDIEVYQLSLVEKIQKIMDIISNTDISFFEKNIERFDKNYNLAKSLIYKKNSVYKILDEVMDKYNLIIRAES